MNNAILFFFNINVSGIKKINDNYYFKYLNNSYGIYLYNRDITEVVFLYNLNLEVLNRGIGYTIILTKNNEILFMYEDKYYILMRFPNVINRIITYDDIISFSTLVNNKYKILDKSNWGESWSRKIDFIEYQFNQMKNKYPIIDKYIDYYIGIWENGISYFNYNVSFNNKKYICHKRIFFNMDLYDFLNPLNFVVDFKERDIGEYIKSFAMNKNFSFQLIDKYFNNLSRESIILVISRLLFPSYFFDLYENIIVDKEDEKQLLEIVNKRNIILVLKHIFNAYTNINIPYISWIKKEIS
ncbi:MAG: hypothetical protein IJL74_00170 [Bacilli bacterium]|nr:hypothetical protein [Bacilli bacterium]